MNKLKLLMSIGACMLGLGALIPLSAHHSFQAEYDDGQPLTLKGKITKVSPDNPHGWIYLDVVNEKGKTVNWQIELPPPNILTKNGFNTEIYREMEKNHEEVTVAAYAAKDGSKHAWAGGLTRSDGKTVITLGGGLLAQPTSSKPKDDRKVNK